MVGRCARIVVGADARKAVVGPPVFRQGWIPRRRALCKVEKPRVCRIRCHDGGVCVPFSEEPEPEHADVADLCDEGVCKLPADGEAGVPGLCVAQVRRDRTNAAKVLDRKWIERDQLASGWGGRGCGT